jgi:hypothetical protein
MTGINRTIQADAGGERTVRRSPVPWSRVVASCLAIWSLAAAVIHFAVAGSHFHEYWLFGVFMLGAAWLQVLWAVPAAVRSSPSRLLLYGGVLLNSGIIAVYVITRTVGDVVGPAPDEIEPAGFSDLLCTGLEAAVVAGCAWLLMAKAAPRVRRGHLVTAAAGGLTAVLLSVALVTGGPEMVMAASDGPQPPKSHMHMAAIRGAPARLATSTPAGAITMPAPDMQMAPGMRMASAAMCHARPTARQQRAAVSLVNASWRGAQRFRSLAAARAAGYRPVTPVGLPVVHYMNVSYYLSTLLGGPVLNTGKPQSLVYANTPRGAVLAAAMYITRPGGATPQPGGCLTQWHVHTNLCLSRGRGVVGVVTAAHPACPPGSLNRVTPPMMHIWFVPVPGGPTAIDAADAQVVRAAQKVPGRGNGTA